MNGKNQGGLSAAKISTTVLPAMVALLILTVILFLPPYLDSFIGDDYVQQWRIRQLVASPVEFYNIFRPNWTDWYYRPLQNAWFLGNRIIFELLPVGYYYFQILWHLLSISLIYSLARKVGVGRLGALLTAVLFAINAEHQLTVDWISSIGVVAATCLSLAAAAAFCEYLKKDRQQYLLLTIFGLWLAALLFHESSIILPFILLSIWWTEPHRRKAGSILLLFGLSLVLLGSSYVYIQLTRENVNLGSAQILALPSSPLKLAEGTGRFVLKAFSGWIAAGQQGNILVDQDALAPLITAIVLLAVVIGFVLLYRWGNRAVRIGIIWTILQLAFILVVLWLPRPDLLGGRHLYPAWAGMSLTIGAVADSLLQQSPERQGRTRYSARRGAVVILGLALFLFIQIRYISTSQSSTLALTEEVAKLENQTKKLLPAVSANARVFASRFLLSPAYFTPAAGVWYEDPTLTGGDLNTLKKYPYATDKFYVFDYEDGQIYNLMPELQDHERTYILWRDLPVLAPDLDRGEYNPLTAAAIKTDVIAGPPGDSMIGISVDVSESKWSSFGYQAVVPHNSELNVSIMGSEAFEYRIRLVDESGAESILLQGTQGDSARTSWTDIELSLADYSGQSVKIFFEAGLESEGEVGMVYWGDPRIVIN